MGLLIATIIVVYILYRIDTRKERKHGPRHDWKYYAKRSGSCPKDI